MAGYGKPLTDDDVVEAQRRDRLTHDMEGVGDAISSAFMRKPVAPEKPYSEADALEQRGQMQDKSVARSKAADDDDPTSPASRALQATFARLHPEAAEYAPGLSFRKIVQLAPHMRDYAKSVEKPLTPPPLAQVNIKEIDPQQKEKTAAEIDALNALADQRRRPPTPRPAHETNPLDDAIKRRRLEKMDEQPGEKPLSVREQAIKERLERQKQQADVPGFEDTNPEHPHMLSQPDAIELRKVATARDIVLKGLDEMGTIYDAHSKALPTSAQMAALRAKAAELQGAVAAVGGYDLTAGHQALQHEMLADPTSLAAYANKGIYKTQLETLRHMVRESVAARAARMQRREAAHGQPQGPAAPHGQSGGETKVVNGVTYTKNARGKWEAEE